MASTYLEFQGQKDEDVKNILEQMEIVCITNHVLGPTQICCLLHICLKGDTWT